MTITIQLAATLRAFCHEPRADILLSAETVQAALDELALSHPSLYQGVCDETGAIRRHVHLFVNDDFIHDRQGLTTALKPGDILFIMPAVSGG